MTMLLSAVEEGSLSAAARAQRVPVSTLTRKITDLEEFLGLRLLTRTTRKLTLTEAGVVSRRQPPQAGTARPPLPRRNTETALTSRAACSFRLSAAAADSSTSAAFCCVT